MNSKQAPQCDFSELKILVVDDQEDVRRGLKRLISSLGCRVEVESSGENALAALEETKFDIVLTDIKMGGKSGVELLNEINQRWTDIEVALITGYGTIDLAVSCLKNGASHFITKPFNNKEILSFIERTGYKILARRVARNNRAEYNSRSIIAIDKRMQEVLDLVEQVAPTKIPVLIEGASGTGKELIAREIHKKSTVHNKPFIAINCIALPDSLLESELFGYKKGAFTGAHKDTKGLFEQVDGGTIFLDEVPSMSFQFQGKLLRVLQEKVIRPLGSNETISVDFRLIVSSNRNLEEMVKKNEFREDLFYRLQVMKLSLPTLNERPECIPALAEYLLRRSATEFFDKDYKCPDFSPAAIEALKSYEWKGNVRELENKIQSALIMCKGDKILPSHFGFSNEAQFHQELFKQFTSYEEGKQKAIEKFQRNYIRNALGQTNGNISQAAELCGITRAAFQRIMRKFVM